MCRWVELKSACLLCWDHSVVQMKRRFGTRFQDGWFGCGKGRGIATWRGKTLGLQQILFTKVRDHQ